MLRHFRHPLCLTFAALAWALLVVGPIVHHLHDLDGWTSCGLSTAGKGHHDYGCGDEPNQPGPPPRNDCQLCEILSSTPEAPPPQEAPVAVAVLGTSRMPVPAAPAAQRPRPTARPRAPPASPFVVVV